MTVLFRNRELAVQTLRRELDLSDGNLASHLGKLGAAGYVETPRRLVGLRFEVHAKITGQGSDAFRAYLAALRSIVEQAEAAPVPAAPNRKPESPS